MSPLFRRRGGDGQHDLRGQILHADPADLGFWGSSGRDVWGAVMDMAFVGGVASLVSLEDGSTSLYTSTGGGVIGGGAHESVVEATKAFLDAVAVYAPQFSATDSDDLPQEGHVRFHALAYDGRRGADAPESELQGRTHELWPLYYSGHQVITALRIATEGDQAR
jgi:hypothetical protein